MDSEMSWLDTRIQSQHPLTVGPNSNSIGYLLPRDILYKVYSTAPHSTTCELPLNNITIIKSGRWFHKNTLNSCFRRSPPNTPITLKLASTVFQTGNVNRKPLTCLEQLRFKNNFDIWPPTIIHPDLIPSSETRRNAKS